jgi:hypothetical protein
MECAVGTSAIVTWRQRFQTQWDIVCSGQVYVIVHVAGTEQLQQPDELLVWSVHNLMNVAFVECPWKEHRLDNTVYTVEGGAERLVAAAGEQKMPTRIETWNRDSRMQ